MTGAVVKAFFEKSSLSTNDLAHIWFLADYDNEGCLNVDKWCVAMHLTVLRRNSIDLPQTLPASLFATAVPGQKPVRRHTSCDVSQQIISFRDVDATAAAAGSQNNNNSSSSGSRQHQAASSSLLIPSFSCDPLHEHSTRTGSGSSCNNTWTKFSDSPTSVDAVSHDQHALQVIPDVTKQQPHLSGSYLTANHSLLSKQTNPLTLQTQQQYHSLDPLLLHQQQTTQPANFDFNASSIEMDPAILHPIPLRLTPEGKNMLQCLSEHPNNKRYTFPRPN